MKNQALNHYFNKSALRIGSVLTVIIIAIALLWQSNAKSNQAVGATLAQVYFEGEYRIGDGGWQPIVEGKPT